MTVALALTDQHIDMGMFVFADGSHKYGTIMDPKLSLEPDSTYRKYIRERQFPLSRAAGMRAGDASWHYGNTVHQTSANISDKRREMMTITYMADGARVAGRRIRGRNTKLNTWLNGLPPGRLAASELESVGVVR